MGNQAQKKSAAGNKSTAPKKSKNAPREPGEENRSGVRVPVQLLVDYRAGGNYLFDFCRDLGTGGAFIQTNTPLSTGSDIELTFTIPDSKETLTTKGKVIWVQNEIPDRPDLVPGMGVQFAGFNGAQRETLERFVQRYAENTKSTQSNKAVESRSA
jgi:type IV pilus assembly protein PilZ